MPRKDGTGPKGNGSMSGRGLGVCTGTNSRGDASREAQRGSRRTGKGNGRGFGQGNADKSNNQEK